MSSKQFLASLSPKELFIIQKENSIADSIVINMLNEEGADNLFLRPFGTDKLVDLNNDGTEKFYLDLFERIINKIDHSLKSQSYEQRKNEEFVKETLSRIIRTIIAE